MQQHQQGETSVNLVNYYKIVLIGDITLGKYKIINILSSLIWKFCEGIFSEGGNYPIGIDFKFRSVNINGESIKLQIWDEAGSERYRQITTTIYKNAYGIILNYDITNLRSFQRITHWLEESLQFSPENSIKILLGNKCDLQKRVISYEEGQKLAASHGMLFLETSSKENINVDQAFIDLTTEIISKFGKTAFLQYRRRYGPQKDMTCC